MLHAGPDGHIQVPIAAGDEGAPTPPNLCHPGHIWGEGRDLLQVVGGEGARLAVRPALSPQDVPVLGSDGTAHNTLRPAITVGSRSIACEREDRQSHRRAGVPVWTWLAIPVTRPIRDQLRLSRSLLLDSRVLCSCVVREAELIFETIEK